MLNEPPINAEKMKTGEMTAGSGERKCRVTFLSHKLEMRWTEEIW